jgi:predicted esterase
MSTELGREIGVSLRMPKGDGPFPTLYFLHGAGGNELSDVEGFYKYAMHYFEQSPNHTPIFIFPNIGEWKDQEIMQRIVATELVPYIDNNFPSKADRNQRWISGFSQGAHSSTKIALTYPDLFSSCVGFAGGVWSGDMNTISQVIQNKELMNNNQQRYLWVTGELDRPHAYSALAKKFDEHGINYELAIVKNASHKLNLLYLGGSDAFQKHMNFITSDL